MSREKYIVDAVEHNGADDLVAASRFAAVASAKPSRVTMYDANGPRLITRVPLREVFELTD